MWISRMRVNGGFLAGLDVQLSPGLNVVVGSRGVGKTTFLELIRHALDVPHADPGRESEQNRAIKDLLGTGEVVLDLNTEYTSTRIVVDADGAGRLPASDVAMMLGQNELEEIASTPTSRLQLIDIRASVDTTAPELDTVVESTSRIYELWAELQDLAGRIDTQRSLVDDLKALRQNEDELLREATPNLTARREQLREIDSQLANVSAQMLQANEAGTSSTAARNSHNAYVASLEDRYIPSSSPVIAAAISDRWWSLRSLAASTQEELTRLEDAVNAIKQDLVVRDHELRAEAEPIRTWLEETEAGLGQLTTRMRHLQTQIAENDRLKQVCARIVDQREQLIERREQQLQDIENWQEEVFSARNRIAREVSQELGGKVIVTVDHLASSTRFEGQLVRLLQGSALQYRPLARSLATTVLPTQLLKFVEQADISALALAAGITADRAGRVIAQLHNREALSSIVSTLLDDYVDFKLRDGGVDKSVSKMSTGQKCAVTLPIVLSEPKRILILDQPEDHLDNAYLVDTVITGIIRRSHLGSQTIVATHNANIPVIGSADKVFYLESDGRQGRVERSGGFDAPDIVTVITKVMEGGRDAFKKRMAFYANAGQLS